MRPNSSTLTLPASGFLRGSPCSASAHIFWVRAFDFMSHHESTPNPESIRRLNEMFKLGATGNFPQGKITERDEGELKLAVGHSPGKVIITFGKEVAWIGFTPQQAKDIAASLLEHSIEALK